MKTNTIKIGGRTFALAFTLDAMCQLQDNVPDFRLEKLAEYVKTPGGMLDLLVALAEQGELLEGRILDVDRKWFGSHISPAPARIAQIQIAIFEALSAGMSMENEGGDAGEEDVVLAEIKKNGTPESSPGEP